MIVSYHTFKTYMGFGNAEHFLMLVMVLPKIYEYKDKIQFCFWKFEMFSILLLKYIENYSLISFINQQVYLTQPVSDFKRIAISNIPKFVCKHCLDHINSCIVGKPQRMVLVMYKDLSLMY